MGGLSLLSTTTSCHEPLLVCFIAKVTADSLPKGGTRQGALWAVIFHKEGKRRVFVKRNWKENTVLLAKIMQCVDISQ